jgi:hypothetical protein
MALRLRSTIRLALSRLVSVSVCLCAFTFLPLPQLAGTTWTESSEAEFPLEEEDGKSAEEELAVGSSARRRLNHRRGRNLSLPYETGNPRCHSTPSGSRLLAIVGHQLANGLGAPLLV